jgi:ABC-type transporter Mla subunit MlaD
MATGTNHYKLGLFMLLGMGLALAFVVTLGASNWNEATVRYDSYFDESIQGLEVGSPVKFRGVTVGRVAAIGIAPDQRHVWIQSELAVPDLQRNNLGGGGESTLAVHPDLRAQLAQAGLTGVKFVLLDYFDGAEPAEPLPFATGGNVIPAVPSTLKGLESSMSKTADQVPEIAGELHQTLARVNGLLGEMEQARLAERAGEVMGQTSAAMQTLEREVQALDAERLSRSVRQSLTSFDATTARIDGLVERLESKDGLLASAERTMGMVGEMARGSSVLGPELEGTLRDVRGAARSLRRFSDALERDPDMLLKGRAER